MNLLSTMVTEDDVKTIIKNLKKTLKVEGDVVELGCNVGTTSVYIQEALKGTGKKFHVYDSFEGIPEPEAIDETDFYKGAAKTDRDVFENNFKTLGIELPEIHVGWFKDLEYPEKISFAFFDGDMYSSIMDSFKKVYPKMSKGGIIIVHDYGWDRTKGVEKACDDFLGKKLKRHNKIGILNIE